MKDRYRWPPFLSQEIQARLKQEIARIIKDGLARCACEALSIRVHTYNLDTRFKAECRCKCGIADKWGFLEGDIPSAGPADGIQKKRRSGEEIRSGLDRRNSDPNYRGTDTRSGKERRARRDRRKASNPENLR
ncbi:MAG: hypothetical protein ABGX83_03025 [Nitrospira sp.]|nr:hypothetical protein [Candidatus Manganitrophaceae bacterium]HIL35613.1 hypothetical protein [Candidatus Manganitrophaceae bacterium]